MGRAQWTVDDKQPKQLFLWIDGEMTNLAAVVSAIVCYSNFDDAKPQLRRHKSAAAGRAVLKVAAVYFVLKS